MQKMLTRPTGTVRLFLAAALLWSVGLAGTASAQYVTPQPPRTGAPTDVQTSPVVESVSTAGAGATGQVAIRSSGQGLPVTGGDVVGLTALGVGAIAAGSVVLHLRRRATQS